MKHLAIDMSSFLWRALLAGTDKENGIKVFFDEKTHTVNSAVYGYENLTSMLCKLLRETGHQPIDTILVFEGRSSKSRRMLIDSTYKGGGAQTRPPEAYEQFHLLRTRIGQVWRDLGATAMIQDLAEGDDTLAWLAREYPGELTIATYDGDLTVLNTEEGQTNAYGGTCKVWIDGNVGLNKYGSFEYRRTRIYKALVGDSSDGIKGCAGMGPETFFKLVECVGWDGIDELEAMLDAGDLGELHALAEEDSAQGKLLKKLVKSEESVIRAWKLVQLRPDWIDTMQHPLQWVAGKVALLPVDADERLADWYGSNYLITADNYQDALDTLAEYGSGSPFVAFDIETSTPPESDDWLASQDDPDGVDTIGSVLTGFSLTFGANLQHTFYVSVDHARTRNIRMSDARRLLETVWLLGKDNVIHNTFFELPVLYQAQDEDGSLWRDHWANNGYRGFVPRALDTKYESSYVDENLKLGLKLRSSHHLGYEQASYDKTTLLTAPAARLAGTGGRLVKQFEQPAGVGGAIPEGTPMEQRRYKMRELPAKHVFAYGADDTICTAALHGYYRLFMHLEHTWQVCLDVETGASYLHAKAFVDGVDASIEKCRELEKIDTVTYDRAWSIVRAYLIKHCWAGTTPPAFGQGISAAEIKYAYAIVTGQLPTDKDALVVEDLDVEEESVQTESDEPESKDPVLKSRMRTASKFPALIREVGQEIFATKLERCIESEAGAAQFTQWVNTYFKGDPVFKISNKQMQHLLYTVMQCPIQVRGKATANMRAKGIREGNPKGDNLAIEYALRDMAGDAEIVSVLQGLKLLQMVRTRRSLYYSKYPNFMHWKTGKIHASHNQCATNTRRASESKPNRQQLPKHPKIAGEPARFREVIVPHRKDAVIVSIDFDSQELRLIAEYSRDENMVACFVGDDLKSMHSLTGNSIMHKRRLRTWAYDDFQNILAEKTHPDNLLAKEYRALGKKANFTTEFGAMAPKLAQTLLCSEEDAQIIIEAKEAMFPGVVSWKESTVADAREAGHVCSLLGAVRHLRGALTSNDRWEQSKAERQAVNYRIQGSAAEMTKCAEGRMWDADLDGKFDAKYIGPVHDECLWSVAIPDLENFIPEMHACMTAPYGDMWIPVLGSISFGPSFGQQIEIGTGPTPEAIQAGVAQLREMLA